MGLLGVASSGRPRPRILVVCRLVGDEVPLLLLDVDAVVGASACACGVALGGSALVILLDWRMEVYLQPSAACVRGVVTRVTEVFRFKMG